jgi:hypothetical protein
MERLVPDTAGICQGAIRTRTLLGVPTSVSIGLGAVLLILVLVWGHWWTCLPGFVVYGWLRWQTKKDPLWLRSWWEHLHVADEYHG